MMNKHYGRSLCILFYWNLSVSHSWFFHFPVSYRHQYQSYVDDTNLRSKKHLLVLRESQVKDANVAAVEVGDTIGSGSYGTVHLLRPESRDLDEEDWPLVGKRPWKESELQDTSNGKDPKERASRCLYYWQVEEHCFEKLPPHPQLPPYRGVQRSGDEAWMVFDLVGETRPDKCIPAPTLSDLMKLDLDHPHQLKHIAEAMNTKIGGTASDGEEGEDQSELSWHGPTMDTIMDSLLTVLSHIHENQIVHRDIKPSNLLVHEGKLLLMDFGSAADLEPTTEKGLFGRSVKRYWGLEEDSRVAVSPIYCAPEIFVDRRNAPTAFDIFSSGLLFCQLLFGYLEERIDAGFHQQLEEVDWDLNAWLANELGSKVSPDGLDYALEYLATRPGLWTWLQGLLQKDPSRRLSASEAKGQLQKILEDSSGGTQTLEEADGPFFAMVIESMESCVLPTVSRPLHFVATFSRKQPLGLVLAEWEEEKDESDGSDEGDILWRQATKDALPGEVFVKEVLPNSQADSLGIFEVGDRLQGIGELPFVAAGFEKAIEMLQDQPTKARNVRLHFDRVRVRENSAIPMMPSENVNIEIVDQGVWSTQGRRKTQEDAFVLHEIHDTKDRSILFLGVMDGHGGKAASELVSSTWPSQLSNEIVISRRDLQAALEDSWETVCRTYRQQCDSDDESCIAGYDEREGKLMASTGSENLIAGTTASVLALDEASGELLTVNCGDSRSAVISSDGNVKLVTEDHTPETEEERLLQGISEGLGYSAPVCRISKWTIPVGQYVYAVGRSLEGPFVTSKGIVSDPDILQTRVVAGDTLLSATDGLWEVMDSDEVARTVKKLRDSGENAAATARFLCSQALKKGTADNVSVIVVYL